MDRVSKKSCFLIGVDFNIFTLSSVSFMNSIGNLNLLYLVFHPAFGFSSNVRFFL